MNNKNFEKYELKLTHEWSDGNGHYYEAEKPLTCGCTIQNTLCDYNTHCKEEIVDFLCMELQRALRQPMPEIGLCEDVKKGYINSKM